MRSKLETIGENTSEITNALLGLVPVREAKADISDDGFNENEQFSRMKEAEAITEVVHDDLIVTPIDHDKVHYVTNKSVLNVLEITKEIKHPRTISPKINFYVPITNKFDVPPENLPEMLSTRLSAPLMSGHWAESTTRMNNLTPATPK